MNSPFDLYLRHVRHITAIFQSLQDSLEGHEGYTRTSQHLSTIWLRIGELANVEDFLKAALIILSDMTEAEIGAALKEYDDQADGKNGGQSDE
jgi:hypothetical protein